MRQRPWLVSHLGVDRRDLIQAGILRLAQVLDTINVDDIQELDGYLYKCVYSACQSEVNTCFGGILPPARASKVKRFLDTHYRLSSALRREPTPDELSSAMDLSTRVIKKLVQEVSLYGKPHSLDAPLYEEEGKTLLDTLASPDHLRQDLDEAKGFGSLLRLCSEKEFKEAKLSRSEARRLRSYYGLGEVTLTLEEIASGEGISIASVQSNLVRARDKLFCFFTRKAGQSPNGHPFTSKTAVEKLSRWQKGVECWESVAANYKLSWAPDDFVKAVARYHGYKPSEVIKRVPPGKPRDVNLAFARYVIMGLMFHVGQLRLELIARTLNSTFDTVSHMVSLLEWRLAALGFSLPKRGGRKRRPGLSVFYTYGPLKGQRLHPEAVTVHIVGFPHHWAIKRILSECPKLKTIRVLPGFRYAVKRSHRNLCQEKRVRISFGYLVSTMAWSGHRSPTYEEQREFMLHFDSNRKSRFKQLLAMKSRAAIMTARYFCFRGEKYLTLREVGQLHGIKSNAAHVSKQINAVLYYLDYSSPKFTPSKSIVAFAGSMVKNLERAKKMEERKVLHEAARHKVTIERIKWGKRLIGVPLSGHFPLSRLTMLRLLVQAKKRGRLQKLEAIHPRAWRAITLRFGLNTPRCSVYRTLDQTGKIMNLTRERVRQLESKALEFLNIPVE